MDPYKTLSTDIYDDACSAANTNRAMRGQYFEHAGVFQSIASIRVLRLAPSGGGTRHERSTKHNNFHARVTWEQTKGLSTF